MATIDPDPFFDFTQERPEVYLDDDESRVIRWPDQRVPRGPVRRLAPRSGRAVGCRTSPAIRDVRRRASSPSHGRWGARWWSRSARRPRHCPHTRLPQVVGSSTNDGLVSALGLAARSTRASPVWSACCRSGSTATDIPAISLRVGVPHYLGNARHPQSSAALLRHLEHVLGVPTGHARLDGEVGRWRTLHDEAVAEDRQAAAYVAMLEIRPRPARRGVAAQRRRPRRRLRALPPRAAPRRRPADA